MEKKDSQNLQHISDTLDEVLVVLKTPENKFVRTLNLVATFVGILAIIEIVEKIFKLILGG